MSVDCIYYFRKVYLLRLSLQSPKLLRHGVGARPEAITYVSTDHVS